MKAEELKKMVEDYKKELNIVPKSDKTSDVQYDTLRKNALNSYLTDVTPVSQYINEQFSNIKDGKSIGK